MEGLLPLPAANGDGGDGERVLRSAPPPSPSPRAVAIIGKPTMPDENGSMSFEWANAESEADGA
jgi:hypothetical protein